MREIRWSGKGTVMKENSMILCSLRVTDMNLEQDFISVDMLLIVLQPAFGYHPTPAEPHQYTSTHRNRAVHPHIVPAPEYECNNIRNMLSNKKTFIK